MTRKLSDRDRAMIAMHGEVAILQLIEQAEAAARAEAERLRERVAALEAALDQSRCICSTNPCEAFDERCPVHGHKLESPT